MTKEIPAQCVLGNGECEMSCPLFDTSKEITQELGDNFDPFQSRLHVVFGDAFNPDIDVTHIAGAVTLCEKEIPPQSENQQ